jgi:hypothetical protein
MAREQELYPIIKVLIFDRIKVSENAVRRAGVVKGCPLYPLPCM